MGPSAGGGRRPDAELVRRLTSWGATRFSCDSWRVTMMRRPGSGWSNETLLLTVEGAPGPEPVQRLVVRAPLPRPVFPKQDPAVEAAVLEVLGPTPVPAPRVVAVEREDRWIGAPFIVVSFELGRPGPEVPTLDPWLLSAPPGRQRRLHEAFIRTIASIHAVDWGGRALEQVLRGGRTRGALEEEVAWWSSYVEWATDGSPPSELTTAVAWCRRTVPRQQPPASLCWGDARIGNVLLSDGLDIRSLLDWDGACIGPGELDLAWYLVLDELVERFTGRRVPGFLTRDEAIVCYEAAAGRRVRDLEWHEVFALLRSVAIGERLAKLAAEGASDYRGRGGTANPVLQELGRRIDGWSGDSANAGRP